MKKLLSILLIFALSAVGFAGPDEDALALLHLAAARQRALQTPTTPHVLTYAEGCAEALRTGKSLMTYVGMPVKNENDYGISCEAPSLPGYPAKCIVLSIPRGGVLYWAATLDENGKRVEETAKAVQPPASPFPDPFSPGNSRSTTAQRDGPGVKAVGLRPGENWIPHAGHNCPACGARQTTISGRGPGGTHTHACPNPGCRTVWYH